MYMRLTSDERSGCYFRNRTVYAREQNKNSVNSFAVIAEQNHVCAQTGQARLVKIRRTIMEKITSFTINHLKLEPGVYVSRKDKYGDAVITTFDLRMTTPNKEPVMNTAEVHTIEHLGATYLRNDPKFAGKTVYFGPMGCRTGFYMLLAGDYSSKDVVPLVTKMFEFIRDFRGEVPGAAPRDCGNYLDQNLGMANWLANRYLNNVLYNIDEKHLVYPE